MSLFPKSKVPYFIYAPSYTHTSSGVRTLHLLCHMLNQSGEVAYLIPDNGNLYATNPALNTPLLLPQHQNYYRDNFIAVYPDIVKGNPWNAKHVVRYLLAPRGAYGGDEVFSETDQIWGALPSIADNVLRIPVSDPGIFYPPAPQGKTHYTDKNCFYSHKYDRIHGNELLPITKNATRLEGSLEEIADILRENTVCYLYEVSSILTEAALCGCLVILVRTPYFSTIDPDCMMGNVMWDDGEVVKQCDDFTEEYDRILGDCDKQLSNFILKTRRTL